MKMFFSDEVQIGIPDVLNILEHQDLMLVVLFAILNILEYQDQIV